MSHTGPQLNTIESFKKALIILENSTHELPYDLTPSAREVIISFTEQMRDPEIRQDVLNIIQRYEDSRVHDDEETLRERNTSASGTGGRRRKYRRRTRRQSVF